MHGKDPIPVSESNLSPLDGGPSFSFKNRMVRFVWIFVWKLFASWTPASMHPWRRLLLRLFGARMGKRSDVRGSARVWLPSNLEMEDHALIAENVNCYNQALIKISKLALVSQGAYLCAGSHNIDDPDFQLITRPIHVGSLVWIAAESFVGPGCVIEEGAVLGARAVAFGRLLAWTVYVGNPAKPLRTRSKMNWGKS
ncbi:MAG: putative colanic acid biosynthesis acetyltransferase [Methylotenera sp.]